MDCASSVRIRDFEHQADGHVAYVVEFQTTDATQSDRQTAWLITRRFSDFAVLRKALRCAYSLSVVPPLPGRTDLISTFRQRLSVDTVRSSGHGSSLRKISGLLLLGPSDDNDLPTYRCHALQTFLRHLLLHHHLRQDLLFLHFIHEEGDWKVHLTHPPYSGKPRALPDPLIPPPNTLTECSSSDLPDVSADASDITNNPFSQCAPHYLVNTSLLKNRATALRVAFQHLEAVGRRLLESCTYVHRLHKNYAEALWQWCPYENEASVLAHCLQTIGHELDTYSSVMDPASEEFDNLSERFHVWENYGHSLTEVHLAYQNLQRQTDKGYKRRLLTRTSSQETPKSESSIPIETDQSPLASAARHILSESTHFEALFDRDLISILHAFAYSQFRQAERCLRIWDRIQSQLQHVAVTLEIDESQHSDNL